MRSHWVLHTVWCNISGEAAAGEMWSSSLWGVKGRKGSLCDAGHLLGRPSHRCYSSCPMNAQWRELGQTNACLPLCRVAGREEIPGPPWGSKVVGWLGVSYSHCDGIFSQPDSQASQDNEKETDWFRHSLTVWGNRTIQRPAWRQTRSRSLADISSGVVDEERGNILSNTELYNKMKETTTTNKQKTTTEKQIKYPN